MVGTARNTAAAKAWTAAAQVADGVAFARDLVNEPANALGPLEFAARLTREHKVAVIPVSVFYAHPPQQHVIRFCFAKNDDTLRQAAERLRAL